MLFLKRVMLLLEPFELPFLILKVFLEFFELFICLLQLLLGIFELTCHLFLFLFGFSNIKGELGGSFALSSKKLRVFTQYSVLTLHIIKIDFLFSEFKFELGDFVQCQFFCVV